MMQNWVVRSPGVWQVRTPLSTAIITARVGFVWIVQNGDPYLESDVALLVVVCNLVI